jgi:hypothetical protein
MIARKQEISLQLSQLIDALLLGGVFWLCHFLRYAKLPAPDSLENVLWMPGVIVPSGPFLLELQGFYKHLGTEAPVNASHRHNVGRVILTFTRIDKVRRAVESWLSAHRSKQLIRHSRTEATAGAPPFSCLLQ